MSDLRQTLLQLVPVGKRVEAETMLDTIIQLVRDEELKKLFDVMPAEDQKQCLLVMQALLTGGYQSRSEIKHVTRLSYQIAGKHIDALEAKGFIRHQVKGRGKIYYFTQLGSRFIKMYKGGNGSA